jgi:hypothetical protein
MARSGMAFNYNRQPAGSLPVVGAPRIIKARIIE